MERGEKIQQANKVIVAVIVALVLMASFVWGFLFPNFKQMELDAVDAEGVSAEACLQYTPTDLAIKIRAAEGLERMRLQLEMELLKERLALLEKTIHRKCLLKKLIEERYAALGVPKSEAYGYYCSSVREYEEKD